jgi:hypothetical protein
MRFRVVLALSCVLTFPGCAWLGEILFDSLSSKRGTSREPGISTVERQARYEEERIAETLREFDKPRRAEQKSEWERKVDAAFAPQE